MRLRLPVRSVVLVGALLVPWSVSAQDDDEDFRPGMIERTTHDGIAAPRIVAEPVRISDAKPQASAARQTAWEGRFLVRGEGPHQFHAFLSGQVRMTLGDRVVLDAKTDTPQWISGPRTELEFGEYALVIDFQPGPSSGQLKLYWSSDTFPLEPLPYHALFHDVDSTPIREAMAGRDLLEAWRCQSCHADRAEARPLPGPSLKTVGAGTDANWLRDRLTRTEPAPHGRMPAFGFSKDDADAILSYLARDAKPPALPRTTVKRTEKDQSAGEDLVKSVGCLACHGWKELGKNPLFGGGALDGVAKHRSPAWIEAKLRDPHGLNPASRMPVFTLSDAERRQIVLALVDDDATDFPPLAKAIKVTDALVARGRELVREARCGACHELPGEIPAFPLVPPLRNDSPLADRGCLAAAPDATRRRPRFHATAAPAIAAALTLPAAITETTSFATAGERLLQTKGCLHCHDRNGSRGLSAIAQDIIRTKSDWEGQAPTLAPPSLTAVGDRLQDEPLNKAIRGELPPRMTWLKVRMPKFQHSSEEADALTAYLIGHDRIPDAPPATPKYPVSPGHPEPEIMLAGRELTGAKGFSCIACHQLKDYTPPKVALGTRGSDLYRLGDRIRAPYFFRWTRSPLRILPGVEMPSYLRPHPVYLDGELDRQLAAIWDALHDPQFTAPTNPTAVEQLWGPSLTHRPRVIRDVFTLTDADGRTITLPKSFAVGFANRHNVLFDLEHAGVRAWTIGDFARQRTQGKSWFWDLAGVSVAAGLPAVPDVFLWDERTRKVITPETGWSPHVRLLRSFTDLNGKVGLDYELTWSRENEPPSRATLLEERWSELDTGWSRSVSVAASPTDHTVWLRRPAPAKTFGDPLIDSTGAKWSRPDAAAPESLRLADPSRSPGAVTLTYTTAVIPPAGEIPSVTPPVPPRAESVTCVPGFDGVRLPLPRSIMPTAMTWNAQGTMYLTSLKGQVFQVGAVDEDGAPRQLTTVAEGLASPFGVFALGDNDLLVAHKPEVLRLRNRGDDRFLSDADVVASGWGFTEDYHDWTCGIVQDSAGRFYIGLGSDYAHRNRPKSESQWRGHILRFDLDGRIEPLASGLRYPTGLAMLPDDRLFVSDQQGVQNCFNELNFIQAGHRYGVPAQLDPRTDEPADPPAVQIPHPWTRSVNGVCAWPASTGHPFAGQIVGAEYNNRFLLRATVEEVDGVVQGAVYPLSRPGETNGPEEFLGPMCVGFSPEGNLYVGSIHDSGWLGGLNTGDIVRLTPNGSLPNGLLRVRATPAGFALDFLRPVDSVTARNPDHYKLSGYQRIWDGNYATPDSGRHNATVKAVTLTDDGRTVNLSVDGLKTGHVYDIAVGDIGVSERLWPSIATYTLHRRPRE